jgi:hypothetical protein
MKKFNYPYIASGLGLFLLLIVYKGSEIDDSGHTSMPLLTLLAISEVAFFVTAIGAYIEVKQILSNGFTLIHTTIAIFCALLAVKFMMLGIELWPV